MRRPRVTVIVVLASLAALACGGATRMSSAAFTSNLSVNGNAITVDAVSNYFQVMPGTAVQPGTSTPIATGSVNTLSLAFGTVPSAQTFTNVFTVKNVSAQTQTATLGLSGVGQLASAAFASSGTASATLVSGASSTVQMTTSSTVAGLGSGTLRLGLGGSTWLYRDYGATVTEAPEAPTSVTATSQPAAAIHVGWAASSTTVNLSGYDVYRATGAGPFAKITVSPVSGTSYTDATATDGTTYTYKLRAVATGGAASVYSGTAAATADGIAPSGPTAVTLANGGGQGSAYINLANESGVSVSVTLPASSVASDTVRVTLSNGAASVSKTAPAPAGGGSVTVSAINASSLADGTVTISATSSDTVGNVSTTRTTTAPKDTVAPGAPTASYVDVKNVADEITGVAEANASLVANQTAPSASGPYSATADAAGSFTITVAVLKHLTVTYVVTATDAAGNASAATTATFADVQ
ncbi:MAG: hypothetical protein E6G67_04035 [Actinobacteria bacterium]|nr:MAG: hypothetical protein E6G67_04035 [Actinomycetota bacterium]